MGFIQKLNQLSNLLFVQSLGLAAGGTVPLMCWMTYLQIRKAIRNIINYKWRYCHHDTLSYVI